MTGCCPKCGHKNVIGTWTSEKTITARCIGCNKKLRFKLEEKLNGKKEVDETNHD